MSGRLPADETNLAVRAYALVAARGRQAVPLPQPDPARARARLVGGSDRARTRGRVRGGHSAEELLALGLELESHQDNLGAALPGGGDA